MADAGTYIVLFDKELDQAVLDGYYENQLRDLTFKHKYTRPNFRGFAATMTDAQLEAVLALPGVSHFEPDGIATAYAQQQLAARQK